MTLTSVPSGSKSYKYGTPTSAKASHTNGMLLGVTHDMITSSSSLSPTSTPSSAPLHLTQSKSKSKVAMKPQGSHPSHMPGAAASRRSPSFLIPGRPGANGGYRREFTKRQNTTSAASVKSSGLSCPASNVKNAMPLIDEVVKAVAAAAAS